MISFAALTILIALRGRARGRSRKSSSLPPSRDGDFYAAPGSHDCLALAGHFQPVSAIALAAPDQPASFVPREYLAPAGERRRGSSGGGSIVASRWVDDRTAPRVEKGTASA